MIFLHLLPALFSFLLLAAHFLRYGDLVLVGLLLGMTLLPFIRRPWAAWILQLVLAAGAVEWIRTLVSLAGVRSRMGEPWERLALILGACALLSLVAILPFHRPRLRKHFRR